MFAFARDPEHTNAVLKEVADRPDDIEPRLEYGKLLKASGDVPRSRLIEIECALFEKREDGQTHEALVLERESIWKDNQSRWLLKYVYGLTKTLREAWTREQGLAPEPELLKKLDSIVSLQSDRGIFSSVKLNFSRTHTCGGSSQPYLDHLEFLFRNWEPVEPVFALDLSENMLVDRYGQCPINAVSAMVGNSHLSPLRELNVQGCLIGRCFSQGDGDDPVISLWGAPAMQRLEVVNLCGNAYQSLGEGEPPSSSPFRSLSKSGHPNLRSLRFEAPPKRPYLRYPNGTTAELPDGSSLPSEVPLRLPTLIKADVRGNQERPPGWFARRSDAPKIVIPASMDGNHAPSPNAIANLLQAIDRGMLPRLEEVQTGDTAVDASILGSIKLRR
jgi:hypothetical protein